MNPNRLQDEVTRLFIERWCLWGQRFPEPGFTSFLQYLHLSGDLINTSIREKKLFNFVCKKCIYSTCVFQSRTITKIKELLALPESWGFLRFPWQNCKLSRYIIIKNWQQLHSIPHICSGFSNIRELSSPVLQKIRWDTNCSADLYINPNTQWCEATRSRSRAQWSGKAPHFNWALQDRWAIS